jgi:hypothetical protein
MVHTSDMQYDLTLDIFFENMLEWQRIVNKGNESVK